MKINFNKEDLKKFNKLVETKEINMAVASMFMDYNTYIDVVDEKEMKRSKNEVETYLNIFLDFFSISRRLKENREINFIFINNKQWYKMIIFLKYLL